MVTTVKNVVLEDQDALDTDALAIVKVEIVMVEIVMVEIVNVEKNARAEKNVRARVRK